MGNVSDKLPDDTRSPPTLDLSRFSSANGDQSSCSLEWFDAPENISTGSVAASKDEVDSVFRSLPRKIAPDPSLECHANPSSSLDLEPKNHFLGGSPKSKCKKISSTILVITKTVNSMVTPSKRRIFN
ncbi:unnamed protein product [Caenorhabditis brenneri]